MFVVIIAFMKTRVLFISVLLLTVAGVVAAQSFRNPALRQKLLDRLEKDQKVRNEIPNDPTKITPEYVERLQSVD